jgi:DNA-binding IclR family transcriptional regulator
LAEQLDMPKPSVHRLLSQLEEVGVVSRDLAGKGYTVGPVWLRLAIDALTVRARQPAVRGIMRKLVDQVRESCNLAVLRDHEVLYLERVECDWPLRVQLQAGSRVPIHCTASGKLLLAQMSSRNRRKLLAGLHLQQFTHNTLTDPELLEKECKTIRASGISINKEEYHLGLIGVAVPIRRSDSAVVAALAIHAPSFRMSVETALDYVPLLQEAAAEIASETGLDGDAAIETDFT